jgi:hypothetical protein
MAIVDNELWGVDNLSDEQLLHEPARCSLVAPVSSMADFADATLADNINFLPVYKGASMPGITAKSNLSLLSSHLGF